MAHDQLLAAGRIGPIETRNRIVMPAMDQNLCDAQGMLTEANIAHYEQRAEGGVGLLIIETSAVSYPAGAASRHQPNVKSDECIDRFAELAKRCHAHGSKVVVQICHHGKTALVDTADGRDQLLPSLPAPPYDAGSFIADLTIDEMMAMAKSTGGAMPTQKQATADDLAFVVDDFATAAARLQKAGCDGIEIHASHGYLVSSFLSPYWNKRDDEYGGSVEGRTRLLQEIIRAIRAATGPEFGIIARLDGTEFLIEGGITLQDAIEHARAAEAAGADAVHISAMGKPDVGMAFTEGPLPWKIGQYRDLAKAVKSAVSVPVIAVGRLVPDVADEMIGAGEADFASMGRQLLADPDLARRLADGSPELVRPCINCFVCVAQNFFDGSPRCAVNARLGRAEAPALDAAPKPRHLVVVGAGPAGMEAARVAAMRGHRVTLLEKSPDVGGTARFSSVTTPMNGEFVNYLAASLAAADVDVQLSTVATPETIAALSPDAVVIATGAVRERPAIPGAEQDHVLTGDDLRALLTGGDPEAMKRLPRWQRAVVKAGQVSGAMTPDVIRTVSTQWMPLGKKVVVIGGGLVGVEIAEFMAERGRQVVVLEEGANIGVEMAHPRRWRTLHEARSHGVSFVTNAAVSEITSSTVVYSVDDESHAAAAEHVIVASGVFPDRRLADELSHLDCEVHVIGDAAEVTYIEGAVRTGYDLGAVL